MIELTEIELGPAGLRFVAEQLAGGLTFSRLLLGHLDLERGEAVTHLPPGVALAEAVKFDQGGKLPYPPSATRELADGRRMVKVQTTRGHLARLLAEGLAVPGRVGLLENATASREDPWLHGLRVATVFVGQEVYHWLAGPVSAQAADEAIKRAQSPFQFVGALSSLAAGHDSPADRGELAPEMLHGLAEATRMIFVGAYDGEGYVIWRSGTS